MLAPFRDARFCGCFVGCWFSFFNGVTQSAQNYLSHADIGRVAVSSLTVQTGMRFGQLSVSPWLEALADRLGNRPVMIASQLVVAAGLFLAAATPEHWAWFVARGHCGLPTRAERLPAEPDAEAVARTSQRAIRRRVLRCHGLCYAASTIVGGALVDQCGVDIPARRPLAAVFRIFSFLLGGAEPRGVGVAAGDRFSSETGVSVRRKKGKGEKGENEVIHWSSSPFPLFPFFLLLHVFVSCQNGRFSTA